MPESPIRKLTPFSESAKKKGIKVYHLNIGQPDIKTPPAAINAIKNIQLDILEYTHSAGIESYRKKLATYYKNQNVDVNMEDIIVTSGGSEALLFALMKSENPAASALARTYPGGRSAFVSAMNAKAKSLGMTSTHYMESTGLHPGNVASARVLGILVNAASQYGLIRQFSTTASYDFNLGYRVLKSNNTNALVRNGGWNINISKTGFINEAGRCVVMHTTLNNRPAVVVLLGADSSAARTNDATRLMNWASQLPKRI